MIGDTEQTNKLQNMVAWTDGQNLTMREMCMPVVYSHPFPGLLNNIMPEENISWFWLDRLWLKLNDPVNLVC